VAFEGLSPPLALIFILSGVLAEARVGDYFLILSITEESASFIGSAGKPEG
jgi:hypothetical protein